MGITFDRLLISVDRCDACGARAKVIATLASGRSLAFCGHHASRHRSALKEQGAKVTEVDD